MVEDQGIIYMHYIHEFGIIASIEKDKEYIHYEPEKYDCIIVDDDLNDELSTTEFGKKINTLKTFIYNINRPLNNLN